MTLSDRLLKVARSYHLEARKCAKAKAFLAATVLEVSVLEALLQGMCCLYMRDVAKTKVYQAKKFRGERNRALELSLNQLINVAGELGWFPSKHVVWAGRRTDLRGFAHEIREMRNHVHPGKRARDQKPFKFTKGTYDAVYEVRDVAHTWLRHHVEQRLLRRIERSEAKAAASERPTT